MLIDRKISGVTQQLLPQHLEAMRQRVQMLYRRSSKLAENNEALSTAFEELAIALEVLRTADAERQQRDAAWSTERAELEAEVLRYQDLFTHAPAGYLITSLDGTIRQGNALAAAMLRTTEKSLVGRSLALFVPEGQRRAFRSEIAELRDLQHTYEWQMQIQTWDGNLVTVELMVAVMRGRNGRPTGLRWLILTLDERTQIVDELRTRVRELEQRLHAIETQPERGQQVQPPVTDNEPDTGLLQRQCAILAEVSVLLAVAHDVEAVLAHVAQLMVPAMADGCILDLIDPRGGRRRLVVTGSAQVEGHGTTRWQWDAADADGLSSDLSMGSTDNENLATVSIDLARSEGAQCEALRRIFGALSVRSAIVVPLRIQQRVLGSLTLVFTGVAGCYTQADVVMVEELARRIAIAVDRA